MFIRFFVPLKHFQVSLLLLTFNVKSYEIYDGWKSTISNYASQISVYPGFQHTLLSLQVSFTHYCLPSIPSQIIFFRRIPYQIIVFPGFPHRLLSSQDSPQIIILQ